jgi:hypothetical protein
LRELDSWIPNSHAVSSMWWCKPFY